MQLTESSIFINLKKLRERLYGAQFHMNKADRIIYGTPLMEASGQSLGEFVLAFLLNGEKKLEHLECSIAWFTRLRIDAAVPQGGFESDSNYSISTANLVRLLNL